MMDLLKTNIYDVQETTVIVGSCLKRRDLVGYQKLELLSDCIYDLCLEESHINMAITKICGMLSTGKIKHLIFASVDKSPHCTGMHYIKHEIERVMKLDSDIKITNYVVVNGNLVNITPEAIRISKNLSEIQARLDDER